MGRSYTYKRLNRPYTVSKCILFKLFQFLTTYMYIAIIGRIYIVK